MKFHKYLNWFKSSKIYIFLIGLSATLWFLIRVIPKPSRAAYPCMRAAAPLMSSFILYLLGVSATWFSFKKFKSSYRQSRYLAASAFIVIAISSAGLVMLHDRKDALASLLNPVDNSFPVPSNQPIGAAKGMFPGRVVWIHDPGATNEDYVPVSGSSDFWYSNANTNENVVRSMLELAILRYAGKDDIYEAWDAIFKSFNAAHGKGEAGYSPGEKFAIKINLTNQSASTRERPLRMDATPQLINALLNDLINVVGVDPADILLGDPYRDFRPEYVDLVKNKYPKVKYLDGDGGSGVYQTIPSAGEVLVFSDKQYKSTLPQHYLIADYFINIPCLKTHNEGGITLIAKNHQGSYLKKGDSPQSQSAFQMHYSLPKNLPGAKKYRHTVDYMGHKDTGGKALIYIIDGIWGGESWQGWIKKFVSAPFNNDYPNSIFLGQDPVALESVGFDILFQEYVEDNSKAPYPIDLKAEVADYLSQCASSEYWPDGIQYDPEGDGTPIGSLGVFEHWNNPADRQYSRNLGTGEGVELYYYKVSTTATPAYSSENVNIAFPNPFSEYTEFRKPENISENADLKIYNLKGQLVETLNFNSSGIIRWNGNADGGDRLEDGMYFYMISDIENHVVYNGKVMLRK